MNITALVDRVVGDLGEGQLTCWVGILRLRSRAWVTDLQARHFFGAPQPFVPSPTISDLQLSLRCHGRGVGSLRSVLQFTASLAGQDDPGTQ